MVWLGLAASLLFSAGGVCLCFWCFQMLVLLPRWRRDMRALECADDRCAFEDVVPVLKMAETKAGGGRGCEQGKSFS